MPGGSARDDVTTGGSSGTFQDVCAAMSEPGFYAQAPETVEVLETAISMVFIVDDLVYKLKKPIALPFLDQRDDRRRRELCLQELRLNRRLTEGVYLGVRAIVHEDGRLQLCDGDPAEPLEWAVQMRRLPLRQTLAARHERGELRVDDVQRVAQRLAEFHAGAEQPEAPAGPGEVKRQIDENFQALLDMDLGDDEARAIADAQRFFDAMLAAHRQALRSRARQGRVRDGHGDLRLEHIVLEEHRVQVFDCVEFEPRLRQVDVACDLAYLVMDLAANDADDLAVDLIDSYRQAGGDPGNDSLVWFFAAYRAWVRIKLAYLNDGPAEPLLALQRRLRWHARRPLLLVVCGVSASGKSTVARELQSRCGYRVLDSDEIRKQAAGLAAHQPAGPERYTPAADRATYRELGERAGSELAGDGGVIIDATCRRREDRDALSSALGPAWARRAIFVECRAPSAVLRRRAGRRESEPSAVSDATAEIAESQRREWAELDEIGPERQWIVRSDRPPANIADDIEAMLDRRASAVAEADPP